MRKNLMVLDELQGIDLKLDGFRGEREGLQAESAILDSNVAAAEAAISAKNEELSVVEEEKRALDDSLSAETENINRSESRLKEIKTQKEYQAVSKEISTAKKLKVELEEMSLKKLGQSEALREELKGMESDLETLRESIERQKTEVTGRISKLEEGMSVDVKTREELLSSLPASLVKRYTLLREQRRGLAVVEARAGSCLGCNMNLPPQVYNTLFRGDDLITCPHCQRILVLRQEAK